MKRIICFHLIGYLKKDRYNYGKICNYFDLYDKSIDYSFNLKKDFQFFQYCPFCGTEIDKVKIVSRLYNDLSDFNSRRLFK